MENIGNMEDEWKKELGCASSCFRCKRGLGPKDRRILSIRDHKPVCMDCKRREEKDPDYENESKLMIASCIEAAGKPYGDPEGFCFHHFCPYRCRG